MGKRPPPLLTAVTADGAWMPPRAAGNKRKGGSKDTACPRRQRIFGKLGGPAPPLQKPVEPPPPGIQNPPAGTSTPCREVYAYR